MRNTLYVRNAAQKVLFDEELKGQLSDGYWENDDTDKRLWDCEVVVAKPDERLGCNFHAKYPVDFADDEMMEWLGDHMIGYAKGVDPNYDEEKLFADLRDLTMIVFKAH